MLDKEKCIKSIETLRDALYNDTVDNHTPLEYSKSYNCINQLVINFFANQLTVHEIHFLQLSEEQRENEFVNCDVIWNIINEKLERQKDVLESDKRYEDKLLKEMLEDES